MSRAKYALHPGFVTSETDGDRHWITGAQLARCYGIPLGECTIVHPGDEPVLARGVLHLGPRRRGDYAEHLKRLKAGQG